MFIIEDESSTKVIKQHHSTLLNFDKHYIVHHHGRIPVFDRFSCTVKFEFYDHCTLRALFRVVLVVRRSKLLVRYL